MAIAPRKEAMSKSALTIVGLGYVGLPLAQEASHRGLAVTGFDVSKAIVGALNDGRSHIDDLSDEDVGEMLSQGFRATFDPADLGQTESIVICVPTPLGASGTPDLSAVEAAGRTVAENMSPGTLVVLESTTYPGTTEDVLRPILESGGLVAGQDFTLAYSPERIDPGNEIYGVRNTPKVVGGIDEASTSSAVELYGRFIDTIVPTSGTREAEMSKLLENTYRHVNIALVNEMVVFCKDLGIDLWEVIDAAKTKPFGFQAFYPGPGVGGHCIPIDPNYLSYKVRSLGYPFRFVELAQEISERMPSYVVQRAGQLLNEDRKALNGSTVLLLGVTYKRNISDQRESPAINIGRRLRRTGACVVYCDPHVDQWTIDGDAVDGVTDAVAAIPDADLVILLQDHDAFDLKAIETTATRLLDTRGRMFADHIERL